MEKDTTSLPSTRKEALERGFMHYDPGKPCNRGHTLGRLASTGACLECNSMLDRARQGTPWRWAQQAYTRCKKRAMKYNVPIDIEIQDIYDILMALGGRCPVFGVKMRIKGRDGRMTSRSASVDRLDPDKGYVKGNITVLSVRANLIKSAYTSAEILVVGKWLKKQGY